VNIAKVTKEEIIVKIEKSACPMLKDKLSGDETKAEVVEFLSECSCPAMAKAYCGVEDYLGKQ